MRMWMIPTGLMCQQHLLGEHVEIHMLLGCLKRRKSIEGFIRNNLVEVHSIVDRHAEIVEEMEKRNINHQSNLSLIDLHAIHKYVGDTGIVDRHKSLEDLSERCEECCRRINEKLIVEVLE